MTSAFFAKVLCESVKRLAKLAPVKYKCNGNRVVIYADTRDKADILAKLIQQYFCIVLTYKYLIPHTFCEMSVVIEENK
ncbi:MAG: hypothetical protein ACO2PN_21855 [Pyrobaculum sp.]